MQRYLLLFFLLVSISCKIQDNSAKSESIELCLGCGYSSSYSKDFFKIKLMYQNKDTIQLLKYFKKDQEPNKFYTVYYLSQLQSNKIFKGDSITNKQIQNYKRKNTKLIVLKGCTDLSFSTVAEFYNDMKSEGHTKITRSLDNKVYWNY